ncbi:MAG: hypothetical protein HXS46_10980 [Theionarchaea archaeon]|nr:MAG: hypothetical protein AYK18_09040 [Theionarchaea archaeon DG-70]MBU7011205.1 hypothetical protein [Theionarchaea archaeon]
MGRNGGISVEELMKIADLGPGSRNVNAKVHVIEKGEPREVVSRRDGSTYQLAEVLVGDPSGCILMSAWNEDINLIEEGANYKIINGYVNVFKNSMRLTLGRKGQLERIDEEIQANKEVNLSVKEVKSRFNPRTYGSGGYGR